MNDIISFILCLKLFGGSAVVLDGDIVCTDDGEGNITIELESDD